VHDESTRQRCRIAICRREELHRASRTPALILPQPSHGSSPEMLKNRGGFATMYCLQQTVMAVSASVELRQRCPSEYDMSYHISQAEPQMQRPGASRANQSDALHVLSLAEPQQRWSSTEGSWSGSLHGSPNITAAQSGVERPDPHGAQRSVGRRLLPILTLWQYQWTHSQRSTCLGRFLIHMKFPRGT
jgi:hypothetical protein